MKTEIIANDKSYKILVEWKKAPPEKWLAIRKTIEGIEAYINSGSIPVEKPVKPACERCKWMEAQLKKVIAYPTKAQGRRTKDGYPQEFLYDEFAYKRLVDSFRQALKDILKDSKSV